MDRQQRDQVRDLLLEGKSTDEIARTLGIPKRQVGAVRAHVSKGHYGPKLVEQLAAEATTGHPPGGDAIGAELSRQARKVMFLVDNQLAPMARASAARVPELAEKEDKNRITRADIGRLIQMRRIQMGMKRKDLADAARLSYQYVSAIENGTKQPALMAMVQLADALHLQPSDLMFGPAWTRDGKRAWVSSPGEPWADVETRPTDDSSTTTNQPVLVSPPPLAPEIRAAISEAVHGELATWARTELPELLSQALRARAPDVR